MELFVMFLLMVSLIMVAVLGIKNLMDGSKWGGFWKDEVFWNDEEFIKEE